MNYDKSLQKVTGLDCKAFIESALKGGWTLDLSQTEHYNGVPLDKGFLLDKTAWEAVGKVEG